MHLRVECDFEHRLRTACAKFGPEPFRTQHYQICFQDPGLVRNLFSTETDLEITKNVQLRVDCAFVHRFRTARAKFGPEPFRTQNHQKYFQDQRLARNWFSTETDLEIT